MLFLIIHPCRTQTLKKKNDYKYSCGSIPYQCCLALLHESRPPLNFFIFFFMSQCDPPRTVTLHVRNLILIPWRKKKEKEKKNNHSLNLSIYFSSLIEFEWLVVILYYII